MVKRVYEETEVKINKNSSNRPAPEYLERINRAIESEYQAIREYEQILDCKGLPTELRNTIYEIINDEKDHAVLLSDLLSEHSKKEFPDNVGEVKDKEPKKESRSRTRFGIYT